ncbi:uncharacterized protein ACBR49_018828 [Aulostomus maculatus]
MAKAEVVSVFGTDRLAAASREILAVVERLVAAYEEEAAGFRLEIERQRRQLELLPPPRPAATEGDPDCSRSLNDEEEILEDSDHPTQSRAQPTRPPISQPQTHVDLRLRLLEDSQTDVLSKNVFQKCPVQELQCPRSLQEPDFLCLLRSTFPQLAGGHNDKPFVVLTSDKRRRLRPLKLERLTPEEIDRHCGGARSTLYIKLKDRRGGIPPPQNQSQDSPSSAATVTCGDAGPPTSVTLSSSSAPQLEVTVETEISQDASEDREEVADGDWKPDSEEPSESKEQTKRRSRLRRTSGDARRCKACGALPQSDTAFVKHIWTHADDHGHVCGVCGETANVLGDHLQNCHKTNDCHICGEEFLTVSGLDEHVAAHSGEKTHKCTICHEVFALTASLEIHKRNHETGKRHKCYSCHKVFVLKEELRAHRLTHTNRKSYLCGVCGKSLSTHRSLSRHKMTHSSERPHCCQVCGRCFKLIGTLKQHEKIHRPRERTFLCDVCCKMFLTSKQLHVHMRQHTNEKPFHCGQCGKGFTTKGPLTAHMRVHTGETPYHCPVCGWSFKRKIHLDNHMTVHSGLKPFVCGICGKACARKTYLTVHMRTHNGERPYKCDVCDKDFTQSHCLKTHMKSHQVGGATT